MKTPPKQKPARRAKPKVDRAQALLNRAAALAAREEQERALAARIVGDQLVGPKTAESLLGMKRKALNEAIEAGRVPPPIEFNSRLKRFRLSDLKAVVEGRWPINE